MTEDNYERHFKVLGKLVKFFDDAAAGASAQTLLLARLIDQVATGEVTSLPAVALMVQNYSALVNAIASGNTAIQAIAKSIASAYLTSNDFCNDLTIKPTNQSSVASVLAALVDEMDANSDNKTLTVRSDTGIVNFFDQLVGQQLAWNTSDNPDYPDSTYVVSDII